MIGEDLTHGTTDSAGYERQLLGNVLGMDILDRFRGLSRDERVSLLPHVIGGLAYEALGDDFSPEEAGDILSSMTSLQSTLEHQQQSRRWRAEEEERRRTLPIED